MSDGVVRPPSVRPEPVEGSASTSAGQALAYVKAAALLLDLPLDEARAERVAGHFIQSAALAQLLEAYPLQPDDELVAIYSPAPFPCAQGGRRTP